MRKNKKNLFSAMLISSLFKIGKKFLEIGYYLKKNYKKFSWGNPRNPLSMQASLKK